jgi:ATP-dependent DNA helicase DinG
MIRAGISPPAGRAGLDIKAVLSADGYIARSFSGYEFRPQQVQMACTIKDAFVNRSSLVAEAGTGIGKSFAYLIPAIELVHLEKTKVLISTFTITLQEQLINKDIPFLAKALPQTFTAVLAKGRGNYLCKRRLEFALRRQGMMFDDFGSTLAVIKQWAEQTEDGSLSDIPILPKNHIWDAVKSEHGNCRGRKCSNFQRCFYWRARRRLDNADIIVANHALMFSDLVLKSQGASILPDYKYIVIDEAHNIEHVAEDHFGINISNYTVKSLLDALYNPRTHKGLLTYMNAHKAIDIVALVVKESRKFFSQVNKWFEQTKDETAGRCYKNFVEDNLSGHLKNLHDELAALVKTSRDVDEKFEIMRLIDRCSALMQDLNSFLIGQQDDFVYWVEPPASARGATRLRSAPLNVGPNVKNCLFDKYDSVILTSATLSSGPASDRSGFEFFTGRIGLGDFRTLKLGSPFDYAKQVTLYIEKDLPDPNDPAFIDSAAKAIDKYVKKTQGRAFVLFTSYEMLQAIAQKCAGSFAEGDFQLLQQGEEFDRTALLKLFKTEDNAVLFGTDSFWQGVDVPGPALSNVIIVRLPFAVPDQPLIAGRLEQIRQLNGDPFNDYQLPSAILKFKQGFGRLIRSKTDTGIVAVLDSRIINKSYGQKFLAAIPTCKIEIVTGAA